MLAHNFHQDSRTQDIRITQDVTFDSMLLGTKTLEGLKCSGFYKPSPIQLHGIPLGKCGFEESQNENKILINLHLADILLEAKSGTGKTAVFAVIALEKLEISKGLQSMILAPTREIAAQICDVIKQIGSCFEGFNVEVVMGGLPLADDIEKFKKPVHIAVGSPGRLKHLIQDKYIDTSAVRLLVFDEADKLLGKSFLKDIDYIYKALPKQKQVIMSSATFDGDSKEVINNYTQNAQHICPDSTSILLGLVQKFTVVKCNSNIVRQTQLRFAELLKVLSRKTFKQCIIFCNYQARVSELHKLLSREKWPAEQLYGQQEQLERLDSLKTLQEYKCRILISTDLAARGIDASNVDLVINFEPPYDWQTYLHRIGRAGRFGSYGIAISILAEGKEFTKFHSMLNNMNINLTKLWTEDNCVDPNNSENSQTSSTSSVCQLLNVDTKPSKSYEVLWHNLTRRDNDATTITESFEKLCESFLESDASCGIASFSDLMQSFSESNNLPEKRTSYKHMKLDMIPEIKEYFIDIKDTNKDATYFNSLVESNGKQTYGEQSNGSIYIKTEVKKSNLSSKSQAINCDLDCHEALIKAGLPTEFSSHKNIQKSQKYKDKNSYVEQKSNSLTKGHLASHNLHKKSEDGFDRSCKISNETSTESIESSDEESTRTEFSSTSSYHNNPRFNNMHSKSCTSQNQQKYTDWYRQLKLRINQIQMMVYIDEMSNL